MITFEQVPSSSVALVLPRAYPLLAKAIEGACTSYDYNKLLVEMHHGHTFLAVDNFFDPSFAISYKIVNWGGRRVLYAMFVGGDKTADWGDFLTQFDNLRQRLGCDTMGASLRKGLLRKLDGHVKIKHYLCELEINDAESS